MHDALFLCSVAIEPGRDSRSALLPYATHSIARRLLDNDPEAVGEVMRWISAALTVPRYWSLRGDWPDLLQEAMARVLDSLRHERFDPTRDLRLYVQGIARFVSLEEFRRRRPLVLVEDDDRSSDDPDPESQAIQIQLVHRVLDMASEDCRELIGLYYLEAKSHPEIASLLQISEGTIKSRLFRCLAAVRKMLRQHRGARTDRKPA